jgi:hypothetical protein
MVDRFDLILSMPLKRGRSCVLLRYSHLATVQIQEVLGFLLLVQGQINLIFHVLCGFILVLNDRVRLLTALQASLINDQLFTLVLLQLVMTAS